MRGRVGRSNKKAFCYFITPPDSSMTEEARKRINALVQFSELGSGFNIAMKDLEIRGAGDLLGGEQSGFINEIGFDTYQKIMNEAIDELKENEFKDLYEEENNVETKEYVKDILIDTDFELLFPDEYVNSITERLNLYNELGQIKNEEALQIFEQKLIDLLKEHFYYDFSNVKVGSVAFESFDIEKYAPDVQYIEENFSKYLMISNKNTNLRVFLIEKFPKIFMKI